MNMLWCPSFRYCIRMPYDLCFYNIRCSGAKGQEQRTRSVELQGEEEGGFPRA